MSRLWIAILACGLCLSCKSLTRSIRGSVRADELKAVKLGASPYCANVGADVTISAVDSDGDAIDHPEADGFFAEAVELSPSWGKMDGQHFVPGDPLAHLDQPVTISAVIKGKPQTVQTLELTPTYDCPLSFVLEAPSGANGATGSSAPLTPAGQVGANGQNGQNGADGRAAAPIDIDLYGVAAPSSGQLAVVYARWTGTIDGFYGVYDPARAKVAVTGRGGNGGAGGHGGDGGRGSAGSGCNPPTGGGVGGSGGNGGNGGAGPAITVRYDSSWGQTPAGGGGQTPPGGGQTLVDSLKVQSLGGSAGHAGHGGSGGRGGSGGVCENQRQPDGPQGPEGPAGAKGTDGYDGPAATFLAVPSSGVARVGQAAPPQPAAPGEPAPARPRAKPKH